MELKLNVLKNTSFQSHLNLIYFTISFAYSNEVTIIIPVTTASAERNFSVLKHVKMYLRNSMTQSQLNDCMLLHIHRQMTENLNLQDIDISEAYFGNA